LTLSSASQPGGDVRSVYVDRLATLQSGRTRLRQQDRFLGVSKLIVAAVAIAVALWLARVHPAALAWSLLPALFFVALWIAHERLLRRLASSDRVERYYRRGLARLEDKWPGTGDDGLRFFDPHHLYAGDLDVFGKGSLYELLCQAASAPGQHTLAQWLLQSAPPDEVTLRQEAVHELVPRLDLRERLAVAADAIHEGTPESLVTWAESRERTTPSWLLYVAVPLGLLWLAALFYWMSSGIVAWLVLISLINAIFSARVLGAVKHAGEAAMLLAPLLGPLHRVLAVYEAERFDAPRLLALTAALRSQGLPPSRAISSLERTLHWLESSDNWFVKLANRFIFWTPLCMFAVEGWRQRHGSHMRAWLNSVGDFEALSSLATFTYERPDCSLPIVREGPAALSARGLTHPLLPRAKAVANDLSLGRDQALIIVSGPNMAGKSTLLRAVGLNVVLAQCGAPVCCQAMELSPLAVGASIHVQDSLQGGLSRFYAEIQRLKQITDLAAVRPTLFLLDELLSGTNSHDRRVGTEALLRSLLSRNAIGIITTHDLALTEIAASVGGRATNVHFGDRFASGELYFDYKLTPGIANSTNALALMRSIGLEV
jgi:MutS domain V